MKRILAAVDHSEPALRAAELAADMARRFDAALVLLTAARWYDRPDPRLEDYLQAEHISDPIRVVVADAARSELQALGNRLATGLSQPVTCEVVVGGAAEAIYLSPAAPPSTSSRSGMSATAGSAILFSEAWPSE